MRSSKLRVVAWTAAAVVVVLQSVSASAQPPQPPQSGTDARAAVLPGGAVVRLLTSWSVRAGESRAQLVLDRGTPVELYSGNGVAGTVAVGHDRAIVAIEVDDARAPFRVYAPRIANGRIEAGQPVRIDRPGGRHDAPFAVAATATPDGFAVFFQEVQQDDPSAAHTYMVRLGTDGRPRGAASEIPVPWSLAAAAWNGNGYHLALFFPGYGDGMRLSMVSTTADGQPQGHPDWASAAGFITDVHLVESGGRVVAFYRGGGGGERLLESDVTQIRDWGSEPPAARDHGALDRNQVIAVSSAAGGPRPQRVSI